MNKTHKNGHFPTQIGLTAEVVLKYLPESIMTKKGHTRKKRKNVCSTKVNACITTKTEDFTPKTRIYFTQNSRYHGIHNRWTGSIWKYILRFTWRIHPSIKKQYHIQFPTILLCIQWNHSGGNKVNRIYVNHQSVYITY